MESYTSTDVEPLPNMDYNIRSGSTLVGYTDISKFKEFKLSLLDYMDKEASLNKLLKERDEYIREYKVAVDSGVYMGLTIQRPSKLTHEEAAELIARYGPERFIVSSDMSSVPSDPLALPRCALKLRAMGVSREDVRKATYENAAEFYGL